MRVLGIDGLLTPRGWVVVALDDGVLHAIRLAPSLNVALSEHRDARTVAVNLPLSDPPEDAEMRACDAAARDYLGDRADQYAPAPPALILQADDWDTARTRARARGASLPEDRLFRARARVDEAREHAGRDDRLIEAHSEISFTAMLRAATRDETAQLAHTRIRSVAAQHERLALLHGEGLRPSRSMGGIGRASPEDVLAATALAWTAHRAAAGTALCFPANAALDTPRLWA